MRGLGGGRQSDIPTGHESTASKSEVRGGIRVLVGVIEGVIEGVVEVRE